MALSGSSTTICAGVFKWLGEEEEGRDMRVEGLDGPGPRATPWDRRALLGEELVNLWRRTSYTYDQLYVKLGEGQLYNVNDK